MAVPIYLYVCVLDTFCLLTRSVLQPSPPWPVPQGADLHRLPQLAPLPSGFQLGYLMALYQQEMGEREKVELTVLSFWLPPYMHSPSMTLRWLCLSTEGGYIRWFSPHKDPFRSHDLPLLPFQAHSSNTLDCYQPRYCPMSVAFLNLVHSLYIIPSFSSLQIVPDCAICFLLGLWLTQYAGKFPVVPRQLIFKNSFCLC